MMERVPLSRSTPAVKRLLAATFPEYRGRKIRLAFSTSVRLENYWDGGTRSYWKAVDLASGETAPPAAATNNPLNRLAHVDVPIPAGVALVEHVIFCGKDCGIVVHVAPGTALTGLVATCPAFTSRKAWPALCERPGCGRTLDEHKAVDALTEG